MALEGDFKYLPNGQVELHLTDGTVITFSGSGEDATIIKEETADHDVYTQFDDQNRPHHAQFHDGTSGDFSYLPNGNVQLDLSDGTTILMTEDNDIISETTKEGDVYTQFDDQNRPHHAQFHDGTSGDFTYLGNGNVELKLSDGTEILMNGDGGIISETTKEGDVYTQFDDQNRPHHAQFHDGTSGDFTYLANGNVELKLDDGTIINMNADGDIQSEITANGDIYSGFDAEGHPHHVVFGPDP
jgi:hypothetical protein